MRTVRGWVERWMPGGQASPGLRCDLEGWSAQLISALDDQSEAFEAELLRAGVELPVFQRHQWLRASSLEHRLFQLRDPSGAAAMQIALVIDRPRRMPVLGRARAWKLGPGISIEAESIAVRALRQLCAEAGDLVSLRLQPYRRELLALRDFEGRARRAGYELCEPVGVTRTLLFDLTPSEDDALLAMSKKMRAKIRQRAKTSVELRPLDDPAHIPACLEAVNAALGRTGGGSTRFDFSPAFALTRSDPSACHILGLFLPSQPSELVAFVIGFRHGELAEYGVAGSLSHPELRSMPFNYWLLWELMAWARGAGARWLDLGGVTDGGPGDPRAGISDFKRHFTEQDVELGRELIVQLQPARAWALSLWSELRQRHTPGRR